MPVLCLSLQALSWHSSPSQLSPQSNLIGALVLFCRANQLDGLVNMGLASRRAISFKDPKSGKSYKLNDKASSGMCPGLR